MCWIPSLIVNVLKLTAIDTAVASADVSYAGAESDLKAVYADEVIISDH
jgi:hypothetical protein